MPPPNPKESCFRVAVAASVGLHAVALALLFWIASPQEPEPAGKGGQGQSIAFAVVTSRGSSGDGALPATDVSLAPKGVSAAGAASAPETTEPAEEQRASPPRPKPPTPARVLDSEDLAAVERQVVSAQAPAFELPIEPPAEPLEEPVPPVSPAPATEPWKRPVPAAPASRPADPPTKTVETTDNSPPTLETPASSSIVEEPVTLPPEKPQRKVMLPKTAPLQREDEVAQVAAATGSDPSPATGGSESEATDRASPGAVSAEGTSAGSSSLSAGEMADYGAMLSGWLNRHKRYPESARRRGHVGIVTVAFTVDGSGIVLAHRIVASSGYPQLDEEVEQLLSRASPLPAPPDGRKHSFVVPIEFAIR